MNFVAHSQWQLLLEEEECQWRKGHLQFDNVDTDAKTQPTVLEQCCNVPNLHGYFSNLESRKCCLKLAAVNTTFSTMRVVSETSSNGSLNKVIQQTVKSDNGRLSDKDFWIYRRALFGANFPVLSVPDPPSETSPVFFEPAHRTSASTPEQQTSLSLTLPGTYRSSDTSSKQPTSPAQIFDSIKSRFQVSVVDIRSSSNSMTSGIESMDSEAYIPRSRDMDEIAVLPAEVLADWHRKVFGLSIEVARVYEKKIYEPYRKRTFAKILVEELCKQLSLLENDSHPFYNSRVFMSREAFGRWQQRERTRIGHMISKFWHNSLPTVKSSNHLDVAQYHEDYKIYLHKIIMFENLMRKSNGSCEVGPQLSSASKRLLKEYTLRYGIRDLYQKIVYLEMLGDNFVSAPGYIQQVIGELCELKEMLPKKLAKSVLVVAEHEILKKVLSMLQGHCRNILTRIKRIYDNSEIMVGVGGVIHLLALVVKLREHLDVDNRPTLRQLLELYTKENLHSSYERHKIIAMDDLEIDPRSVEITPKLINKLVLNIKDEVLDYQRSYAPAYQRYLDVVKFAGQVLYNLLMEDVTNFCVTTGRKREYPGIDLPVLGVAYRLDQLDRESQWADILSCTQHSWRREFYTLVLHWVKMLENHAKKFVLQSVGSDTFVPVVFPTLSDLSDHLLQASRCTSTNSQVSLTPSQHSAFSAVRSYKSLQIPIPSLHIPDDNSVKCSVQSDDSTNVERKHQSSNNGLTQKVEHSTHTSEEILSFQVNTRTKRTDTLSSCLSSYGFETVRCKSEPRFSVHFKDKVEEFDLSRSCDESCLTDAGYFTHTSTDINLDSTTKGNDFSCNQQGSTKDVHISVQTPDIISDIHIPDVQRVDSLNIINASEAPEMHLGMTAAELNHKHTEYSNNDACDVDSLTGEIGGHLAESTPLKPSTHDRFNQPSTSSFDHQSNSMFSPRIDPAVENKRIPESESVAYMKTKSMSLFPNRNEHDSNVLGENFSDNGSENVYDAPLQVSTSAIEVVFLIKRMINAVKIFCDMLYPIKMLSASVCDMNEELVIHLKQSVIMRWKLIETLIESIASIVSLYSYNMLCVDLCGETNYVAKTIVGAQFVEEVKRLYQEKLLWGCRHRMNKKPCNQYMNKDVRYLADKFEPVAREMCTRINNLMELNGVFQDLINMAKESLCLDDTVQAAAKFHLVLDDESDFIYETVKESVWDITKGLLNLMIHRMNLFTREALVILHQLQVPRYLAMETIYKPIINFLKNHAVMLKEWTNEVAYTEMVKRWWKTLVQLLEDLVKGLIQRESMTVITAKRLLQLIASFMRFLCGKRIQLDLDFAESKIESCVDTLNMCTIPTLHLIVIHHILTTDMDSSLNSENNLPPRGYLQDMYRDLHHHRKCFTGSQIVNWILTHPLSANRTTFSASTGNRNENCTPEEQSYPTALRSQPPGYADMFDLTESMQIAENLLTYGAIKAVDWTPLSSTTNSESENIYPDIVHYSTSSIIHVVDSSVPKVQKQPYGSWSIHNESDILPPQSSLKRITSAPQFSLGLRSPIDINILKDELHKQLKGKRFESDSSDDSQEQTLVYSVTEKNKEESIKKKQLSVERLLIPHVEDNAQNVVENGSKDNLSVSSSSTVKDDDVNVTIPSHSTPPVFNINEMSTSSPVKQQTQLRLQHEHPVSGESSALSSSMSSSAFQNSDAYFYCFTDGAEHMISFMSRMTQHLDSDFETILSTQMQQLKRENYCFGFQYAVQNIQPEFILKILNSRRHHDDLARKFLIPTQQSSEYGLLGFDSASGGVGCFGFF